MDGPIITTKYSLWTALWVHKAGLYMGCFNVEIGHDKGPKLDYETVVRLAKKYKKRHKDKLRNYGLRNVMPFGRAYNRV